MSPRPNVSAQRIPQILQAAGIVFAQQGLAAATMSDIAEQAGLSKALLYKYFKDKDHLIVSLAASLFGQPAAPVVVEGKSCSVALQGWSQTVGGQLEANAGFIGLGLELVALARSDDKVRAVIQQSYGEYQKQLEAVIAVGIGCEEFASGDAGALARGLIAQYEGLNLLWLIDPGSFSLSLAYEQGMAGMLKTISL